MPLDVLPMAPEFLHSFNEYLVLSITSSAAEELKEGNRSPVQEFDRMLTSLSRHSLRSSSGSSDCCHRFAHSVTAVSRWLSSNPVCCLSTYGLHFWIRQHLLLAKRGVSKGMSAALRRMLKVGLTVHLFAKVR